MYNHPIIQRITLDLDTLDYQTVLKAVDKTKQKTKNPVEVFRTKHGYHVISYFKNSNYSFWELILMRWDLGDDPKRINHDILRMGSGWPVDVLFEVRRGEYNHVPIRIPGEL